VSAPNLVYCAPTSGGKTLVAVLLMLRRVHLTGGRALCVESLRVVVSARSVRVLVSASSRAKIRNCFGMGLKFDHALSFSLSPAHPPSLRRVRYVLPLRATVAEKAGELAALVKPHNEALREDPRGGGVFDFGDFAMDGGVMGGGLGGDGGVHGGGGGIGGRDGGDGGIDGLKGGARRRLTIGVKNLTDDKARASKLGPTTKVSLRSARRDHNVAPFGRPFFFVAGHVSVPRPSIP